MVRLGKVIGNERKNFKRTCERACVCVCVCVEMEIDMRIRVQEKGDLDDARR